MALSNWDTMAVDEEGKACDGVFKSPMGVEVCIYKNWLYVADEKAWKEGGRYVADTVMSIQQGELVYVDVNIHAIRGPKDGVYVIVWSGNPGEAGWKAMVGIGCYGYSDHDWVGIEQTEIDVLRKLMDDSEVSGTDSGSEEQAQACVDSWLEDARAARARGEDVWPDDHFWREGTMFCYRSYRFDDAIRAIDLSKARRFNQGDAYFATHLGTDTPATAPGEAGPTMMEGIVEEMKNDPALVDGMIEKLSADESSGFPQFARDLKKAVE